MDAVARDDQPLFSVSLRLHYSRQEFCSESMPLFVPMTIVGKVIGKRIAGTFESLSHVGNRQSRIS
jgi:hypothetical protein